ncbi:hypothetical protein BU24DRAFT_423328 [Aaosphaeria arxii CBS 175.79]|uniref:Uncharacterized protein n=1 Tax=Aaosphaeria arxii CBS 175.79 TaxID=1450172 RepID=A0A6A5XN87_9PLEO|nr:uncharacterized protein BU24DRAFT_423328 [Aaosphaeria arxii CBS 175.79]KAF2014349.1 hypothetical protein BU24DRAFT_423328 [Aaosphaeria arxii CBS 175.79]
MSKTASSRTSFFSFGPDENFISKSYEGLRYRDLPPTLHQLIVGGSVVDVHWAALGAESDSWVLSFKDRESKNNLGWGVNTPKKLQDILKSLTPTPHFRAFLGPEGSFIAWDPTFIRWVGLPAGLEAALQSWLTPAGWKAGPPRLVTWGAGNTYFAISEYGEIKYRVGSSGSWSVLSDTVDEWNSEGEFDWSDLAFIALDPTTTDQFVAIRQDRTWAGSVDEYGEDALSSFALNFFHLSKKKKKSKNDAKEPPNDANSRTDTPPTAAEQAMYEQWATGVATSFASALIANGGAKAKAPKKLQIRNANPKPAIPTAINGETGGKRLSEFPYIPPAIATCTLPLCIEAKTDLSGLRACRHDVERLFKASGLYSYEWLRQERIRWHPDRFGRLCEESWRDTGRKLAEEMFKIIDSLITELESKRVNGDTTAL